MNDKQLMIITIFLTIIILIEALLFIKIEQKLLASIYIVLTLLLISCLIYLYITQNTANNPPQYTISNKYNQRYNRTTRMTFTPKLLFYSAILIVSCGMLIFIIFMLIHNKNDNNDNNNNNNNNNTQLLRHDIYALSQLEIFIKHSPVQADDDETNLQTLDPDQTLIDNVIDLDTLSEFFVVTVNQGHLGTKQQKNYVASIKKTARNRKNFTKEHLKTFIIDTIKQRSGKTISIIENKRFNNLYRWITVVFKVKSLKSFYILILSIFASSIRITTLQNNVDIHHTFWNYINYINETIPFANVQYPEMVNGFRALIEHYITLHKEYADIQKAKFTDFYECLDILWGNLSNMQQDYLRIINQIYANMLMNTVLQSVFE